MPVNINIVKTRCPSLSVAVSYVFSKGALPTLESALIDLPKAPKHQNTEKHGALDDAMVFRIVEILKEQPYISQEALGESLGVTRRVVQKYVNALKEVGRIERVGGKRYGHWEILE